MDFVVACKTRCVFNYPQYVVLDPLDAYQVEFTARSEGDL